jgi:hypothetical protein
MRRLLFSIASFACLFAQYTSACAEPSTVGGSIDCSAQNDCFIAGMKIHGDIDETTVVQVGKLLEELHRSADNLHARLLPFSVELDSAGGSVRASFALGRMLRREGMGATIAIKNPPLTAGYCNSACILIYAGATHRYFNDSFSRLGIHRPYLEVPTEEVSMVKLQEIYRQTLQEVRSYLKEMNVSERLAEAMFRIEPEKMRFIGEETAHTYGLAEWDPVYSETLDIQEAQKFGLTRHVFMDRRKRALQGCGWLKTSIQESMQPWINCYDGVMSGHQQAPIYSAPPGAADLSRFGTPIDPLDWNRYPRS